jgi:hypothetical protein
MMILKHGGNIAGLATELRVLREDIQSALQYKRFAFVPKSKAEILDKRGNDWERLWHDVNGIEEDVNKAVDCFALDMNTACAFHMMRVAEHCLRALAKNLRIRLTHTVTTVSGPKVRTHPIEFADWDKVITAIDNKLTAARKRAPGPKKSALIKLYSDAADHCLYMKELRNELSHARKSYDVDEAKAVLNRVQAFTLLVADLITMATNP